MTDSVSAPVPTILALKFTKPDGTRVTHAHSPASAPVFSAPAHGAGGCGCGCGTPFQATAVDDAPVLVPSAPVTAEETTCDSAPAECGCHPKP